jgi:hypothetical protein
MTYYKVALNFFRTKGYIFTFDFKDGYYHIKIHPEFKKYLGFSLLLEGKKVYCQFKVGFLGLADLPWLFTKIFRVLVKHWRSHAMQICLYLDDGWYFSSDLDKFRRNSLHVRSDLLRAGVVWSVKKSFWDPNVEVDWLGMTWNANDVTVRISDHRVLKLKSSVDDLVGKEVFSVRQLASVVGHVISLGPVVGNIARLMSRFCQMSIANSFSYDSLVLLDSLMRSKLYFWKANIDSLAPLYCLQVLSIFGDTSSTGCGSFIKGRDAIAAKTFSSVERDANSTWRELENINFTLKAFLPFVRD